MTYDDRMEENQKRTNELLQKILAELVYQRPAVQFTASSPYSPRVADNSSGGLYTTRPCGLMTAYCGPGCPYSVQSANCPSRGP